MVEISALFDHGDDDPPTERGDSLRVGDRIPQATVDSIFAVLGRPENQVRMDPEIERFVMGKFNTGTRQLTLSPRQTDEELETTLAHELAHQASTALRTQDPEFYGVYDRFISEFTQEPFHRRRKMLADEYGRDYVDHDFVNAITELASSTPQVNELFAEAVGNAWEIARREDPASGPSDRARSFGERWPAGSEIINLFMRRFPREEP